jgi:hypothetical protein
MNVLLLSPYSNKLVPALEEYGDCYAVELGPVSPEYITDGNFNFLVSYGYRHILRKEVLDLFLRRAINLHVSMLPYCRGAHPNFWTILEGKPSGVTIHLLDDGLDTGNILFQQEVSMDLDRETFATTYDILSNSIERLFRVNWKYLRTGECGGWEQQGDPTLHRSRDLEDWLPCLPQSWETPISLFRQLAMSKLSPQPQASLHSFVP